MAISEHSKRWLELWLLFVLALWFYCVNWYPGPGGRVWYGDSVSFQFYAISHSLGHPPGYPQYLALVRTIASVPLGQAWQRVSFASSLFAAGLASLFRYLEASGDRGRISVTMKVKTCSPNVYFIEAARSQIRFHPYRSEFVAHSERAGQDMHRLVCK